MITDAMIEAFRTAYANAYLDADGVRRGLEAAINSALEEQANRTDAKEMLERLKARIDTRLNDCLCEMKPDYDDSIVGFNEAWDIVRSIFNEELNPSQPRKDLRGGGVSRVTFYGENSPTSDSSAVSKIYETKRNIQRAAIRGSDER